MELTIDIGNSLTKVGLFNNTELIDVAHFKNFSVHTVEKYFNKKGQTIDAVILSSVIKTFDLPLLSYLKKKKNFILLNERTKTPIKKKYKTPATLGNDRLAAVCGAFSLFPKENILVIDAGTCIKYDFINAKSEYLGGSISPGLNMRYMALNNYTDNLPLIKPRVIKLYTGASTDESILTGVQRGILFELTGFIAYYEQKYKNIKILLTGGDYHFFAGHLNFSIFAAPQLIHLGLHEILRFNLKR